MKITKPMHSILLHADGSLRVEIDAPPSEELSEILKGEIDVEFTRHREKRSINANAYAWVLIDRLSEALSKPTIEVYCEAVKDIGGVSEYVCIQSKAVPMMKRIWTSKGTGWQVEEMDSKLKGCTTLKLTYGSSVYNSKQMSLLIDHLVQDCEAVGIETKTPDEISELVRLWDEADKR